MEGSDEEEGSLVSSASPLSEEGLEDAQMQQQDSESSSTSSDPPAPGGRRCRNKKASIVVLRIFLALLFIGITGLAVLLLVVTMYFISGTLTGRTGWHGYVMASILIVYATFCTACNSSRDGGLVPRVYAGRWTASETTETAFGVSTILEG